MSFLAARPYKGWLEVYGLIYESRRFHSYGDALVEIVVIFISRE
jgi:hypothetical protein